MSEIRNGRVWAIVNKDNEAIFPSFSATRGHSESLARFIDGSRVAQLQILEDWQKIEDNSKIVGDCDWLVCGDGYAATRAMLGHTERDIDDVEEMEEMDDLPRYWFSVETGRMLEPQPTHYMPMPIPPEAAIRATESEAANG